MRKSMLIIGACIFSLPVLARADVIWPAAILEGRILTWWAILAGLIAEFFVVLGITAMRPARSALATLAMNGVSTVVGIVLIPISGILIEFFPGMIIYPIFHIGTFNPFTWTLTVIVAAAVNSVIEMSVLRRFTQTISKKKMFSWLWLANLVSVALAAGSLVLWPIENF